MTSYTYEQVYDSALSYFKGNELAANVWVSKYALKDQTGNYYELTPQDMFHRLTKALSRIENSYDTPQHPELSEYGKTRNHLTYEKIYALLDDFKRAIPQGSILSNLGNNLVLGSLSNCVVINSPEDSYGGIMHTDQQLVQLMKRRCGVGFDMSTLRPSNTPVSNPALTSTGVVSFMERFSNTTREVGQNNRRGALMLTLDCRHPDIEKFINIKLDTKKVTGANISIMWRDDFMKAVKDNEEYILRWPVESSAENAEITRKVNAKNIWLKSISSAHKSAEPGSIFIDRMRAYSTCHTYDPIISTNPCQPGFAKLKTKTGIVNFSEVDIGDEIWSMEGWTKIVNKWSTGVKKVYAYHCEYSGAVFVGTSDHKILTVDGKKVPVYDCYTEELRVNIEGLKHGDTFTNQVYLGEYEVFEITVDNKSHTYWTNKVNVGNCSEIGMGQDTCRLLAINMFHAVKNPYTQAAYFDFEEWYETVYESMRLMDDIVDLELEAISKILEKIVNDPEPDHIKAVELQTWQDLYKSGKDGRRVGLGYTGLADVLAGVNLKYDESQTVIDKIMRTKLEAEFDSSIDMAIQRGKFPIFDTSKENSTFSEMLVEEFPDIWNRMMKHGRRNLSLSTVAPSGSLSLLAKLTNRYGTSSGIEPLFANWHIRRKKINPGDKNAKIDFTDEMGDAWTEFEVYHSGLLEWAEVNKADPKSENSPYYNSTANDLDWLKRVEIQSICQKYITHSISSTINLPETVKAETVAEIYERAWEMGLKGLTVYVSGSRDGVLVTESKKDSNRVHLKRPKTLSNNIHQVKINGDKWLLLVGLLNEKPYELFAVKYDGTINATKGTITKIKSKHYNFKCDDLLLEDITKLNSAEEQALTRIISLHLRASTPLKFVTEQLSKSETSIVSFSKAVNRVLAKYTDETNLKCEECGSKNLTSSSGCFMCGDCGFSRCG